MTTVMSKSGCGERQRRWQREEHEQPRCRDRRPAPVDEELRELRPSKVRPKTPTKLGDQPDTAPVGWVGRPQVFPGHQGSPRGATRRGGTKPSRPARLSNRSGDRQSQDQVDRVHDDRQEVQRRHDPAVALQAGGRPRKDQGEMRDHRPPDHGPDEGRHDLRPQRRRGQREVQGAAPRIRPRREPERDDGGDREQYSRCRIAEAAYQNEAGGDEQHRLDREDRGCLPRRGQPVIGAQGDHHVRRGVRPGPLCS